jgi:hypothetical protein
MAITQSAYSSVSSTLKGPTWKQTSNIHKNLLILNELLPLYECFQECCQQDDLIEHFGELLDVGQRLLVESNPHLLDYLFF